MNARAFVNQIRETNPWPISLDPTVGVFGSLMAVTPPFLRTVYDRGSFLAVTSGQDYPSAKVHRLASEEWVIEVTSGLIAFLHSAARSIALLIPEPGSNRDGWDKLPEAASRLAELLWWYRVSGRGYPSRFPDDQREEAIASTFVEGAILFLLGHECGHLLLDVRGEDELAKLLPLKPSRNVQHRTEILADGLGLLLAFKLCPLQAGVSEEQKYYGTAEFGLRVWRLMEEVGFQFGKSHPGTGQRIDFLRNLAVAIATSRHRTRNTSSTLCVPNIGQNAGTVDHMFDRLKEQILRTNEGVDERRYSLVKQLDEFLEQNVTVPVANLPKTIALVLALGNPPDLMWAAGRLAAMRADTLAVVNDLGSVLTDEEISIELTKQNLLLNCVKLLLPPRGNLAFLSLLREALSGAASNIG
jgi:hypothetical protein